MTAAPIGPTEFVQTLIAQAVTGTAVARVLAPTATLPAPAVRETILPTSIPVSAPSASTTPPLSPTDTPATLSPTRVPTTAPDAAASPTASPSPRPTSTACPDCPIRPHFWMERPIGPDGVNYPDPTYRYGETQNGAREPHHGVEFQNPAGTPVLAVADGTVVVAGNDWKEVYGDGLYFYGTLVVLRLDREYLGQPVFALYGHLSELAVQPGQTVKAGAMLGRVGSSGVALGPHLHFEVRVGSNDYASTRNPEVWLRPLSYNGIGWGALAGVLTDKQGQPLYGLTVVIRSLDIRHDEPVTRYAVTYAHDQVNADDEFGENFAAGDLPPGTYEVAVNTTTLYKQTIVIAPGQVSMVRFAVNPPPTPTPAP